MGLPYKLTKLVCVVAILGLLAAGCTGGGVNGTLEQPGDPNGNNNDQELTRTVDLYFSDRDGYLVVEKRELPDNGALLETVVRELVAGPADEDLMETIPEGTQLLGVALADGVAVVDFSPEIETNHWGGSLGESITVYSVVNTLCQFEEVQQVKITIDGATVETLAGHLDLSGPMETNPNLVR